MRKMKYALWIVLIIFTACKKKPIEPIQEETPPDYSHFEGNFLCDFVDHYAESSAGSHLEADKVVCILVSEDTIYFQNFKFIIESEEQTTFHATTSTPSTPTTLQFFNNYNTIDFDDHPNQWHPSYVSYNGTRTSEPLTSLPHNDLAQIVGLYSMDVEKENTALSLDTSYSANLPVTFDANEFIIDTNNIYMNSAFISTYSYSSYVGQYGSSLKTIRLQNDSLFITREYTDFNTNHTLEHSYKGKHL